MLAVFVVLSISFSWYLNYTEQQKLKKIDGVEVNEYLKEVINKIDDVLISFTLFSKSDQPAKILQSNDSNKDLANIADELELSKRGFKGACAKVS